MSTTNVCLHSHQDSSPALWRKQSPVWIIFSGTVIAWIKHQFQTAATFSCLPLAPRTPPWNLDRPFCRAMGKPQGWQRGHVMTWYRAEIDSARLRKIIPDWLYLACLTANDHLADSDATADKTGQDSSDTCTDLLEMRWAWDQSPILRARLGCRWPLESSHRQCCDLISNVAGRCQAADTHLTVTSPSLCHELPVEGSIFVPVPAWHLEQVDEVRPPICSHFWNIRWKGIVSLNQKRSTLNH